jgi:alpha-tubulin suppressor-like RCC1 family protein
MYKAVNIALGSSHSVIITEDGSVYSAGTSG